MRCKSIWIVFDIVELRYQVPYVIPISRGLTVDDEIERAMKYYLYRAYHLDTQMYGIHRDLFPLYQLINQKMNASFGIIANKAMEVGYNDYGLQNALVDVEGNDLWICLTNNP